MGSAANEDVVMEQLANAGQLMAAYACCFPPADEIAWRIPKGVGGPGALADASAAWKAGASALQEIQTQLREQTDALGDETWHGKDRDAFDQEISNLLAEIGDSHNTAEAIGITLEVLSPVMAVWPPLCLTAGLAVAAVATAFYIAFFSGIGDVTGASEAAYATGLPVAEAMLTLISAAETVLRVALGVAEGVIATAVFTDLTVQEGHGNSAIFGDLGQAEVDGLGQVTVNLAQYGVSRLLNGKKPGGEGGIPSEGGNSEGPGSEGGRGSEPGPEDSTPADTEPGPDDSDTAPADDEPGPDGGPSDSDSPSDGGDDKTPAEKAGERGRERWPNVGKEAAKIGVDTTAHQTADRTHAGTRLQDLINDKTGWEGAE